MAAPHAPRGGQADVAQAAARAPAPRRPGRRTRGGRARPRGSASRGRGTGREPREPAVLGGGRPVERRGSSNVRRARVPGWTGPSTRAPRAARRAAATAGSRVGGGAEPGDLGLPVARPRGSTAASSARSASTRSRSVPPPRSAAGLRPSGRRATGRPAPVTALALPGADDRGREPRRSWWWALSGRRGRRARAAGPGLARRAASEAGRAGPPASSAASASKRLFASTMSGRLARAVARGGPRRGRRGRSRPSRRPGSRRCTRIRPARRRRRSPRGSRHEQRREQAVYRLPVR